MTTLRRIIAALAIIFAALLFFLMSDSGLRWVVRAASGVLPGQIQVASVSGRLVGPLSLGGLSYRSDQLTLDVAQLEVDWQPHRLLSGVVAVSMVKADGVSLVLAETDAVATSLPVETTARKMPELTLPMALEIGRVEITRVRLPQTQLPIIERVELDMLGERQELRLVRLAVESADLVASASGQALFGDDYPFDLEINWQRADRGGDGGTALQGTAKLTGTLRALSFQHQLVIGAVDDSGGKRGATIHGTVEDVLEAARWQVRSELQGLNPHQLHSAWPALTLSGAIRASGSLTQAGVHADLITRVPDLGELNNRLHVQWQKGAATSVELRMANTTSGGELQVTANVSGDTGNSGMDSMTVNGRGDWRDLTWPIPGALPLRSAEGQFTVAGTLSDYRLTVSALVQQGEWPEGALTLQGTGDSNQLSIGNFSLAALRGVLTGTGHLGWTPALSWKFDLSGSAIDPGSVFAQWPGKIDINAGLSGGLSGDVLRNRMHVRHMDGILRGYPLNLSGTVEQNGSSFVFDQLRLASGSALLTVDGAVGEQWDLAWALRAEDLAALWPGSSGQADGRGSVTGLRQSPHLVYALNALDIQLNGYRVTQLESRADLDFAPGGAVDLGLVTRDLTLPGGSMEALALEAKGTIEAHTVTIDGSGSGHRIAMAISAGLGKAREWRGQLLRADISGDILGDWGLAEPGGFLLGAGKSSLGAWCWRQRDAQLCAQAQQRDSVWSGNLSGQGLSLDALRIGVPGNTELRPSAITGTVAVRASGSYDTASGATLLEAQADTSSGAVRFAESANVADVVFDASQLEIYVDAEGLNGAMHIPLQTDGRIDATVLLPGWSPSAIISDQAVVADLHAQATSLGRFDGLVPDLDIISGRLQAQLAITGTVARPLFNGVAELTDGAAGIPALGLDIKGARIKVSGNETNELLLDAELRSGEGILRMEGQTLLDRAQGWPTDLVISGENVEAVDVPQVRVLVSPHLKVSARDRVLRIDGEVHVPMARIAPRQIPEGSIAPSRDVEIVSTANPSAGVAERWQTHTDVRVTLGDRIRFDGFGLRGKLAGDIRVIDAPGKLTTARGELRVVDGVYQAYGQDLSIARGRLVFADSLLDDPGLDVNATRTVDDVVAGVRVSGTLQDPLLSVYSRPAMGEADTLSYLLFGRPARGTSAGESNQLLSAVQSMGLSKGEDIAKRIGANVGLDEIRVDSQKGLQDAALVMGRYLSPKLYLRYVAGLFSASNVVQIQYMINKSLQVQTETGDRTGVDVFYTIER